MNTPHVLVFPFPAQGHLNPLTRLADFLVSSGIPVTFIHTTRSFSLLSRHSTTRNHPSSVPALHIEVVPDVLPPDDKHNISRDTLFESFPLMQKGLEDVIHKIVLLHGFPPSCILSDSFLPWTHDVALKYNIPRIEVWTMSATVYYMGMHASELAAKGYIPLESGSLKKMIDFIPGLPPFSLGDFPAGFAKDYVESPAFQYLKSIFSHGKESDRVLIHSFYELESAAMDALTAASLRIEPIGPLIPSISGGSTERTTSNLLPEDSTCLEWLDAQDRLSVLYVSFGSVVPLESEVFQELAYGLEASQERFLWVIRPDEVKSGTLSDLLPEGFQCRTAGRSLIVSWAPQLAVLAHPAVGAFLTHCGWNSTIESLCMGVPTIGFPQRAEQNTNLKCMIDLKVGKALDGQSPHITTCNRASVEGAIRAMLRGEEGREARRKVMELGEAARKATGGGGRSRSNLQRLVEDVKHGRLKQSANARFT